MSNATLPANGLQIDTDTVGGIDIQGVKVKLGGPGVSEGYVGSANPLPVKAQPSGGSITDRSGLVITGGSQVQAMSTNSARKYLFVQNPVDATETLYVNFGSAASATDNHSVELSPGGSFSQEAGFVCTDYVSVNAASSNHPFIAKEG